MQQKIFLLLTPVRHAEGTIEAGRYSGGHVSEQKEDAPLPIIARLVFIIPECQRRQNVNSLPVRAVPQTGFPDFVRGPIYAEYQKCELVYKSAGTSDRGNFKKLPNPARRSGLARLELSDCHSPGNRVLLGRVPCFTY